MSGMLTNFFRLFAANSLNRGIPFLLAVLAACFAWTGASLSAQDKPLQTVEETCTAFAYAPDGRIAYSVRKLYSSRRIDYQRDDIWVLGADGKRKKIVNGEKLVQGGGDVFSYAIQSMRWSPDSTRLTVEMLTSEMINAKGDTQEGEATLMIDENGKEIKIIRGDSVIPDAYDATWLSDDATVVYMSEAVKPKLLFHIGQTRPAVGRGGVIFFGHTFSAVAWNAKQNTAVAIERNASLSGPPRLVALDLAKESIRELATLDGFAGGLVLSPSGARVAYYRDADVLEIRELAHPEMFTRMKVTFGILEWAADEQRLLLKRGLEKKTADLVWVRVPQTISAPAGGAIPEADVQPALHGLTFRDFELSPDGRQLAVIEPGKRSLVIYPAQ
jgi:hypothetical protein